MELIRKIRRKIEEGFLEEFAREVRWLWRYICRYRAAVAVHIALGVAGILMGLAGSVASKYLIDAVTGHQSGRIGFAAALIVGMMVGSIVMNAVSGRVAAKVNIRVQNEVQAEVYHRILRTDWESLERFRGGDLLQRLNGDVNAVSGGVTGFIPRLISHLVQFFGALGIILCYDPTMAVIALLGVPVSAVASRLLLGRMRSYNREMKEIYGDVMSFQEDSVRNITSIKAFGITGYFGDRMEDLQARYREKYLDYNKFSVRTSAFMSLMSMVVTACCFGWGVYRLWSGAISYGSMTMFLQLASVLGSAFSGLVSLVPNAISVTTSAGRIMAVTELPAEEWGEEEDLSKRGDWSLEMREVSFTYQSGEEVLSGAGLTVRPGDLVALTGPSGEGKTTLLRILLGLLRPHGGRVELVSSDGERIPVSAATRSAFGYVPQSNTLFSGTVAENLRMARPDATEEELAEALKAACAYEFVSELPGGLDCVIGGRDKRLSEGQAQRIAVARAILRRAPILLLDEATSALDRETESRMLRSLMDSGFVRTCILVTHRSGSRDFCTRSYHVRDGRVCEERMDP